MNTGRKRIDLSIKLQKNPTKLSNDMRQEKTTAMRVMDKAIHPTIHLPQMKNTA